jgi:hypothetical protein
VFDRETCRRRNTIERRFNQPKGFRGIATRYEKTATSYEAAVALASSLRGQAPFEDGPWNAQYALTSSVSALRGPSVVAGSTSVVMSVDPASLSSPQRVPVQ